VGASSGNEGDLAAFYHRSPDAAVVKKGWKKGIKREMISGQAGFFIANHNGVKSLFSPRQRNGKGRERGNRLLNGA